MPGWPTLDSTTNLQSAAVLAHFVNALKERGAIALFTTLPAAGDIWNAYIGDWQAAAEALCDSARWMTIYDLSAVPAGDDPTTYRWTFAKMKTAVLGGNSWTRKYPKEFASPAATVYNDGAAFVNGDSARNRADGIVYTRVAGAWVNNGVLLPDVTVAYGQANPGDYVGMWMFTELRDVLKKLVWLGPLGSGWTADGTANIASGSSSTYAGPSLALAEGDSKSHYGVTGVSSNGAPFARADEGVSGGVASASSSRRRSKFVVPFPSGALNDVARDVYVYVAAYYGVFPAATSPPFDANGDGLNQTTFTFFQMVTVAAGATSGMTGFFGSLSPPNFPGASGSLGYYVSGADILGLGGPGDSGRAAGVARYDIAGGFTYY